MCLALSAEMTYGEQHVFEMAPLDAVQRTLDARSVFERSIIDVPRFGQSLATFLFAFILQQSVSAAHSPPGARGARAAATRRASASRKRAGHKLNESLSVRMVSQVPTLVRGASLPSRTRPPIMLAVAVCCFLYLCLGCLAAVLFGARTAPLITLNFDAFRGGVSASAPLPWWVVLVSKWVTFLPLFTTTAGMSRPVANSGARALPLPTSYSA